MAWAVVVVLLERRFPYKSQRLFREGFFVDFFWYTLVHSYILGFAIDGLIRFIDSSAGISRLKLVSSWPVWTQLLFFFIVHDFYIYWFHRAQHRSKYLWRLHEAHHSVRDVDWVAGSRSHALEILINQTIEYAPIVLLGGHPELALMKGTLDAVWGMYIHSNINVRSGVLQYVFNGPEMHRLHHARDMVVGNRNFSTKIAIWDWLFGTAYLPKQAAVPDYGLCGGVQFPGVGDAKAGTWMSRFFASGADYLKQHAFAFRKFDAKHATIQVAPE